VIIQDRITQLVLTLKAYNPERIILFGSGARGDTDEYSDLDIAIIKETDERFLDRLETVCDLLPPVGAVDVLVYTPVEFATDCPAACRPSLLIKKTLILP
jgi:predicted nucleotidyltransferase